MDSRNAKSIDNNVREAMVRFTNQSGGTLKLKDRGTIHGIFMTDPPAEIPNGATGNWETGSDGTATGTAAWVQYQNADKVIFYAHWANPYWGSNAETHYVSPDTGKYPMSGAAGSGNPANFTYVVNLA